MPRKAITEQDYFAAVRRLKEKKEHKARRFRVTDDDAWEYPSISVGLVARELKCNPSTLYKTANEKIRKDIQKYQKIKRKSIENEEPRRNTKMYYKNLVDKCRREKEILEKNKKTVRSMRIKHDLVLEALKDLGGENKRLIKEKNDFKNENILLKNKLISSYSEAEVKRLSNENARLREIILRNGLDVQF